MKRIVIQGRIASTLAVPRSSPCWWIYWSWRNDRTDRTPKNAAIARPIAISAIVSNSRVFGRRATGRGWSFIRKPPGNCPLSVAELSLRQAIRQALPHALDQLGLLGAGQARIGVHKQIIFRRHVTGANLHRGIIGQARAAKLRHCVQRREVELPARAAHVATQQP